MPESTPSPTEQPTPPVASVQTNAPAEVTAEVIKEIGGRASGVDPTRYGDWEMNGRCIDF